jgi:molecular chaperone Hsp33
MQTDYVQRFIFERLDIRGRLVCLTGAWTRMLEGRSYPASIVELLGHTTALAVLLGANQKPNEKPGGRVTMQVQGSGPVKLLVADCTADLKIRGMAQHEGQEPILGEGKLALTFEDSSGQIYQSLVPLEGASMAEIFQSYLERSDQRVSFLRLHADEHALCGLLLEKLPGADRSDPDGWNRITHLAATLTLAETVNVQPYDILVKLFHEELLRVFRLYPVEYHCPWNVDSVERVLRGLGRPEVESILAEKGEVVIKNEMCNHEYRFDRDAVEAVFT